MKKKIVFGFGVGDVVTNFKRRIWASDLKDATDF